jgi:hypothetical protein
VRDGFGIRLRHDLATCSYVQALVMQFGTIGTQGLKPEAMRAFMDALPPIIADWWGVDDESGHEAACTPAHITALLSSDPVIGVSIVGALCDWAMSSAVAKAEEIEPDPTSASPAPNA